MNVNNLPDIIEFCKDKNIPHDWAFLTMPRALDVRYKNVLTERARHLYPDHVAIDKDNTEQLMEFIHKQDTLRGIEYKDYFNL